MNSGPNESDWNTTCRSPILGLPNQIVPLNMPTAMPCVQPGDTWRLSRVYHLAGMDTQSVRRKTPRTLKKTCYPRVVGVFVQTPLLFGQMKPYILVSAQRGHNALETVAIAVHGPAAWVAETLTEDWRIAVGRVPYDLRGQTMRYKYYTDKLSYVNASVPAVRVVQPSNASRSRQEYRPLSVDARLEFCSRVRRSATNLLGSQG